MTFYQAADKYLLVLDRGDELIASLNDFALKHQLKSAWLSGLGGADGLTLGFYEFEDRDYIWRDYDQALEITNLSGNLTTVDGQPFWHLHGTFSGPDFQAIAGHVKAMTVGLTCELLVTPLSLSLTRHYDEVTGLKLIKQAD